MSFTPTPIPANTLATARAASLDARERMDSSSSSHDVTLSETESAALVAFATAAKLEGWDAVGALVGAVTGRSAPAEAHRILA